MAFISRRAKLLISFVGRHRGDLLVQTAKKAGARGGTIAHGRAVADNVILQALSLADVSQDVVFTLMGEEVETVLPAIRDAAIKKRGKLGGVAVLLDVSGVQIRVPEGSQADCEESSDQRSEAMDSGNVLITIIVNHGYADDVMAAARKAGAAGGTILTAKGTGTEDDVKFFGIALVPEKEMLMIVSPREKINTIMEAVNAVPHLCEPGGGIVYTMPVEQFIILGKDA